MGNSRKGLRVQCKKRVRKEFVHVCIHRGWDGPPVAFQLEKLLFRLSKNLISKSSNSCKLPNHSDHTSYFGLALLVSTRG